jgi:hypothetical protein
LTLTVALSLARSIGVPKGRSSVLPRPSLASCSFTVADDKCDWDCGISRGVVCCRNLIDGRTKKYKITGENVHIASSLLEKTDKLEIYVTAVGFVGVSVDGAKRRLLSPGEIDFNKRVEEIVKAAHNSQFVVGENLRQRYLTTEKQIPSLRLLTVVNEICDAETILNALDNLEYYKKAAKLFNGLNIVFLYSGGNDFVAKLVSGFIAREDITDLYKNRVFMYFIDRIVVPVDVVYYLTRMIRAGGVGVGGAVRTDNTRLQRGGNAEKQTTGGAVGVRENMGSGGMGATGKNTGSGNTVRAVVCDKIVIDNERVGVHEVKGKSYPYSKTVVLQNGNPKPQNVTVAVPIIFGGLSVVSVTGKTVTVVGLNSGRTNIYKLPKEAIVNVRDEMITDSMEILYKTKLAGYEERRFQIIKNEGVLSPKERKNRFLKSLADICVRSADPKFDKIFSLPVTEKETPQILSAVKATVKNVDRALFISILSARNELGSDLWAWLLNKIIGVRLSKTTGNAIQIVPNINISGDFSLSFVYDGKPYSFNVVQNSGGCSINYENGKQNNFLQINF